MHSNLTESFKKGEYVVLAAEPAYLVGVDVMQVRHPLSESVADFFRLMRRQFTPVEWSEITGRSGSEEDKAAAPVHTDEAAQLRRFYQHWCLKESYIKAVGVGLGLEGGLERLSFASDPDMAALADASSSANATVAPSGSGGVPASPLAGRVWGGARGTLDGADLAPPAWWLEEAFLDASHCVATILAPYHVRYLVVFGYEFCFFEVLLLCCHGSTEANKDRCIRVHDCRLRRPSSGLRWVPQRSVRWTRLRSPPPPLAHRRCRSSSWRRASCLRRPRGSRPSTLHSGRNTRPGPRRSHALSQTAEFLLLFYAIIHTIFGLFG
jgi:phosphopantetheine--protein transferase-like protein